MLKELKTILSGDNPIVMLKIFYKLEEIKRDIKKKVLNENINLNDLVNNLINKKIKPEKYDSILSKLSDSEQKRFQNIIGSITGGGYLSNSVNYKIYFNSKSDLNYDPRSKM